MSDCDCEIEIKNKEESKTLIILLSINAFMFFIEFIAGLIGESTALTADSLDMFADALVYAISLYAVGKSLLLKAKTAFLSGILQITLGIGVLSDIIRRFIIGSEPESAFMILVGLVALIANVICLILIAKHKDGDVNMRATWIFSKNDVIANVGVIIGGVIVYYSGSPLPDLIIGLIIAFIVTRGGVQIIKDARRTKKQQMTSL